MIGPKNPKLCINITKISLVLATIIIYDSKIYVAIADGVYHFVRGLLDGLIKVFIDIL